MPNRGRPAPRSAAGRADLTGLLALTGACRPTAGAAANAAAVTVNGDDGGRTCDGIGAAGGDGGGGGGDRGSAGGGNGGLLIDHPAAQRSPLDHLLRPGCGADLQIRRIEVDADSTSTDGAKPRFQPARGLTDSSGRGSTS